MSSYTQIFYHIVFTPKNRRPIMLKPGRIRLFQYLWGILKNKQCHLYRINGVDDHLHIFTSLHPSIALSDLIKDMKISSGKWIKENGIFPKFQSWQVGYGAFTCGHRDKDRVIEYIKCQERHHHKEEYIDELKRLLTEAGIAFKPEFLE
jgi:REP element-mobilizing transposase RayT